MEPITIAVIAAGLFGYSLISKRLEGTVITAPLVFILFGWFVAVSGAGEVTTEHGAIHWIAEFTLILILFTDAARIDLGQLRADHNLPIRMLLVGLPLIVVFGALAAALLFQQFSIWEAALLAALLAPTDAALGQAVVSAKVVPARIRQAINVESGLNDGIALPAVLLFAAFASAMSADVDSGEWIRFGVLQITLGPLAGAVIGYGGARLLDTAVESGWGATPSQGIGILAVAVIAFAVAESIGGNGFIAAFIAGLIFGNTLNHPCTFLFEFMETEGQLLMLITFFLFGAALLPEALNHMSISYFLYALLSLTVIRMVPVALSLSGTGLSLASQLFLGWFGPRGLASILFALLILEQAEVPHHETLLTVTVITVALSALLHGISAAPFAKRYGRFTSRMGECVENKSVAEIPLRQGMPRADTE